MRLPIANRFSLQMNLGNDGMRDSVNVANVLKALSDVLTMYGNCTIFVQSGPLFDDNGNKIGTWRASKVNARKSKK